MAANENPDAAVTSRSEKRGKRLWVFGYGSLCWYPGFPYEQEVAGFIKGFSRRFWQGNTAHRGLPGKPGRVATLVQEPQGVTWGKAYELRDEIAYEYLEQREGALGGYTHALTWFWPSEKDGALSEKVQVLVYMSTPDSPHWLGPSEMDDLAVQVARSRGAAGHNAEYVLRLATFMRATFPDERDEHLFELEARVLVELRRLDLSLDEVMNTKNRVDPALVSLQEAHAHDHERRDKVRQRSPAPSSKHTIDKPPGQCHGMRCLKL